MRLSIQNLNKSFGGRAILSDFSLELQSGVRLCLCGPNGSGKSTLLRLLAGVEAPDAGRVSLPRECRLGYVEQEMSESLNTALHTYVLDVLPDWAELWTAWDEAAANGDTSAMHRLSLRQTELEHLYGYNPEHRAQAVLSGLGFAEDKWGQPLRTLSGGWRERAKLARVLTAGADILLLDEPTNHLDLDAVEWLESFLLEYQGVLVFVAHDRVFMDKVSTHILYLSASRPLFRKGNFTHLIALQEEMEEQRAREATRLQDEIEHKMAFVRRFRAKATKARQAASHQKRAKKLEKELGSLAPAPKRKELNFSWPLPPQSERTVLSVVDLSFAFPDGRRMWDTLSFTLYRGQKVALVGHNGCGKSTVLKLIVNQLERSEGSILLGQQVRLGYFSQHQLETLNPTNTVLSEIRRLADPRSTEEELMSVLGRFLLGQSFFDRVVGTLSGGEKSRLILASLFLARCNFLVLDEPTNHLDLESREALAEALGSFSGTIFMVAHDRHLLTEVADSIWHLTPGGFILYDQGYQGYADVRRVQQFSLAPEERQDANMAVKISSLSREDQKRLKREQAVQRNVLYKKMKPLQDHYTSLEQELEQILADQAETETALADPTVYADGARTTELLKHFHAVQTKAEQLMEGLAELESKLVALEEQRAALE